jgi:hypothetical protein
MSSLLVLIESQVYELPQEPPALGHAKAICMAYIAAARVACTLWLISEE